MHQRIKNRIIKLHSIKINQPKLSIKVLHRIDDILGETRLDKTYMDLKIKMTQTQLICTK